MLKHYGISYQRNAEKINVSLYFRRKISRQYGKKLRLFELS